MKQSKEGREGERMKCICPKTEKTINKSYVFGVCPIHGLTLIEVVKV